jgi:hypothetical protein
MSPRALACGDVGQMVRPYRTGEQKSQLTCQRLTATIAVLKNPQRGIEWGDDDMGDFDQRYRLVAILGT